MKTKRSSHPRCMFAFLITLYFAIAYYNVIHFRSSRFPYSPIRANRRIRKTKVVAGMGMGDF